MITTRLTEQYGIRHPLVGAGMGFIALPKLVAAVSNSGALGLLGVAPAPPPVFQDFVRQIKALTSHLFGVSFVVETTAFGPSTVEEHIDVCIEEQIKLVTFFWNFPPQRWVEKLRIAGAHAWLQTGTTEQAREAVERGFDAIIAQGSEAGGHNRSETGLISLIPAMCDEVGKKVPVIAAGGIADGRTAAAALTLGADAVCIGTRLLASTEASAHEEYKTRVVAADINGITKTHIFGPEWPDVPMSVLRNRVVRSCEGNDRKTPKSTGEFIGETLLFGLPYKMPKYSAALPTSETKGDFEEMCLAAGQGVGVIHEVMPAAEIVERIMLDAESRLSSAAELINRNRFAAGA